MASARVPDLQPPYSKMIGARPALPQPADGVNKTRVVDGRHYSLHGHRHGKQQSFCGERSSRVGALCHKALLQCHGTYSHRVSVPEVRHGRTAPIIYSRARRRQLGLGRCSGATCYSCDWRQTSHPTCKSFPIVIIRRLPRRVQGAKNCSPSRHGNPPSEVARARRLTRLNAHATPPPTPLLLALPPAGAVKAKTHRCCREPAPRRPPPPLHSQPRYRRARESRRIGNRAPKTEKISPLPAAQARMLVSCAKYTMLVTGQSAFPYAAPAPESGAVGGRGGQPHRSLRGGRVDHHEHQAIHGPWTTDAAQTARM